jgi:hypothetical protein
MSANTLEVIDAVGEALRFDQRAISCSVKAAISPLSLMALLLLWEEERVEAFAEERLDDRDLKEDGNRDCKSPPEAVLTDPDLFIGGTLAEPVLTELRHGVEEV